MLGNVPDCVQTGGIAAVTRVTSFGLREGNQMASTATAPAPRTGARVRVQQFGTFLSNMVLPNIGAFIAWGLITALFIQAGWITLVGDKIFGYAPGLDKGLYDYGFVSQLGGWDADGGGIVGPMITYLLPILIGYTGGRMAYGDDNIRGGVVGAIATMGAVTGADVPMFLGAMIMGPLGGWSMRKLDALWDGKIRPGFEMLVNNFSAGIWGMILAIGGFLVAGPFVEAFSKTAESVVDFLVDHSLLRSPRSSSSRPRCSSSTTRSTTASSPRSAPPRRPRTASRSSS